MTAYLLCVGIAVSQLWNALTGGLPDEAFSARSFRAERDGRSWGRVSRPLVDLLFRVVTRGRQTAHCFDAFLAEVRLIQLPAEYRHAHRIANP